MRIIHPHTAGLVVLLLLATALRLYALTAQAIWYDEAAIITYAQMDLQQWSAYLGRGGGAVVGLFKAPLLFLLLKGWIALVGSGELALRLPFALVGAASVVPLYALAVRLAGRPAGLAAAGLLALHPMHIYYSQQVSEYSPLVLGASLSMLLWHRVHDQRSTAGRLALAALNCALLGLHPVAVVLPALQLLWDVGHRRLRPACFNLLPLGTSLLMLRASAANPALLEASLNWIPPLSGAVLLQTARQLSHGGLSHGGLVTEQPDLAAGATLAALVAVLLGGAVVLWRGRRPAALLLLWWVAAPALLLAALSLLWRNQWVPRYLLVALPALAVAGGAGLAAVWRWRRAAGLTAGAVVAALCAHAVWQQQQQPGGGLREIAAHLRLHARPGDAVIISPDRLVLPLGYHVDGRPLQRLEQALRSRRSVEPGASWQVSEFNAPHNRMEQTPAFARWLARRRRVWLVTVLDWPRDAHSNRLLGHLRRRMHQHQLHFFPYDSAHLVLFLGTE